MFPKVSGYVKSFDETNYMSFLIKGEELLEAYNKIWNRVSNLRKDKSDS